MKKIIALLIAAFCVTGICASAKTIQVTLDSNDVYTQDDAVIKTTLDVAAYIENDITMVPIRFVTEELGAMVEWNHDTKEVTLTKDSEQVVIKIGDVNAKSVKDGQENVFVLNAPPVIVNDRTLVPLQFVSENLGAKVEYIEPTRQVLITDEEPAVVVGSIELPKVLFRTSFLGNSQMVNTYGIGYTLEIVYNSLTSLAAIENSWSMIDTDRSLPAEILEQINAVPDDEYAVAGVLRANVVKLNRMSYLVQKAQNMLYNSIDEKSATDYYNQNFVCAKHVLISTVNEETGEPLADRALKVAKDKAATVVRRANSGASFDKLIEEYGQDPGMTASPEGYVFTYGEMVKPFEEATFALAENKISDVVETDYGYHIIKRLPLPEMDASVFENVKVAYVNEMINYMLENTPLENKISLEELFSYIAISPVG